MSWEKKKRIPDFDHTYCVQGLNITTSQNSITENGNRLNSLYWYKAIVRCTHLVARILQHGCKFSSWLKVNKISNQTVHHQSATKLDSMMNYSLENRIWRQTSGWVTCAKPSRQYTDPGVSYTFSRRFLNQNYPKYISDVVSKILEEKIKNNYQMFYLNLWSSRNWVSCGESWKSALFLIKCVAKISFNQKLDSIKT